MKDHIWDSQNNDIPGASSFLVPTPIIKVSRQANEKITHSSVQSILTSPVKNKIVKKQANGYKVAKNLFHFVQSAIGIVILQANSIGTSKNQWTTNFECLTSSLTTTFYFRVFRLFSSFRFYKTYISFYSLNDFLIYKISD